MSKEHKLSIPFDLTCWYLNIRRIYELTREEILLGSSHGGSLGDDYKQKMMIELRAKDAIIRWMESKNIQPLEKLIIEDNVKSGQMFTHHSRFFFRQASSGYSKIKCSDKYNRVSFSIDSKHLTSNSAHGQLSGQGRRFLLGLVQETKNKDIIAIPYVIANVIGISALLGDGYNSFASYFADNFSEIHIDNIDNFSRVTEKNERRTRKSLDRLKSIPERKVKIALARIINEPTIPKDWGGETSDLYSTRVTIDGQRVSTALILKGPSKFHPMTLADLGKRGDQINRLYREPADLLVLQHCHEVTSGVREIMRLFAQQVGNRRLFCIIDGYDTFRILKAYGKLPAMSRK